MKQQKQHLDILISSQEAQVELGNLSETGIAYLNGLKQARKIVFGEEYPAAPYRYIKPCPSCLSSNIQEGSQFHKCLSCGNIFT